MSDQYDNINQEIVKTAVDEILKSGGKCSWHGTLLYLREEHPSASKAELEVCLNRAYMLAYKELRDNPLAGTPMFGG